MGGNIIACLNSLNMYMCNLIRCLGLIDPNLSNCVVCSEDEDADPTEQNTENSNNNKIKCVTMVC